MPRPVFAGIVLTLLGWTCLTHQRAVTWQSELTLWTDAAAKAPLRPRAFINLGIAKELSGDLNGASQAYLTAINLSFQPRLSTYSQVFHRAAGEVNQARVMALLGHVGMALGLLDQVIDRHPHFAHAVYVKAVVLALIGECQEAAAWKQRAGDAFPEVTCRS